MRGAMLRKLQISGVLYLAVALIFLGLQIPIRLRGCAGLPGCLTSLAGAPLWALIWPVYWVRSGLAPALALQAAFFFSVPLVAAMLLLAAWNRCQRVIAES
jgi:hypothetical protein